MWETSCSTLLHCIPSIANAETPAPDSALEDAMARPIPIAPHYHADHDQPFDLLVPYSFASTVLTVFLFNSLSNL